MKLLIICACSETCINDTPNHYHSDGGGTISEHIETPSDSKVLLNYVFFTYHYNFKIAP